MALQLKSGFAALVVALGCAMAAGGQVSPQSPAPDLPADSAKLGTVSGNASGSIHGTIVDGMGAFVAGAKVSLTRDEQPISSSSASSASSSSPTSTLPVHDAVTGEDGQFSFSNISSGVFHLKVTADGFAPQISAGTLAAGENSTIPPIALVVATAVTQVDVGLSRPEVAQEQIEDQEKQRVLGVIPNFYVSYAHNAVPLTPREKFQLAWKTSIDPVTFGLIGVFAGIQQAQNDFAGYGQGAQGYGKRYGASYADFVSGTFIGAAILPVVFKQDPRYFYKGSGSKESRFFYAIANSVICKGDNGHWQTNYSNILGSLAAGGISNLYYPKEDRNDASLTFENAAIGIAATAAANLVQEFIIRRLTPSARRDAGKQ
jgi:Carboxypeptidase regulatory-like domain